MIMMPNELKATKGGIIVVQFYQKFANKLWQWKQDIADGLANGKTVLSSPTKCGHGTCFDQVQGPYSQDFIFIVTYEQVK
jgi:hypothetical protein